MFKQPAASSQARCRVPEDKLVDIIICMRNVLFLACKLLLHSWMFCKVSSSPSKVIAQAVRHTGVLALADPDVVQVLYDVHFVQVTAFIPEERVALA